MAKYNRSAIITGEIDFFCLVCEEVFRNEDDVAEHILEDKHKKNLDKSKYIDNFREECIRKVKNGYYCEYCNILLSSSPKVTNHVSDEKHSLNKTNQDDEDFTAVKHLKWHNQCVVAFNDLIIEDNAWNALIDSTCVLCDTDFEDADLHKRETSHILKVIQTKVHSGIGNTLFRKIDESYFQCLTCNEATKQSLFLNHFDSLNHDQLYTTCRRAKRTMDKENMQMKQELKIQSLKNNSIGCKSALGEGKRDYQFNQKQQSPNNIEYIQENTLANKTEDSNDKDTKNILVNNVSDKINDYQQSEVKKPIGKILNKEKVLESKLTNRYEEINENDKKDIAEYDICKELGIQDYIYYETKENRILCLLCDWVMGEREIASHVKGEHHLAILKLQDEWRQKRFKKKDALRNVKHVKQSQAQSQEKTASKEVSKGQISKNEKSRSEILGAVSEFQLDHVVVDFITDKAFCKQCNKSLDFDFNFIKDHIDSHANKKESNATDTNNSSGIATNQGSLDKEIDTPRTCKETINGNYKEEQDIDYGKENNISFGSDGKQAYCQICKTSIPRLMSRIKEHVDGTKHKTLASKNTPKAIEIVEHKYKTITFKEFLKSLTYTKTKIREDFIVNEIFCIEISSFMTCTKNGKRLRCEVCEESFYERDLKAHSHLPRHLEASERTVIVVTLDSEFVREVRPGMFHCGYCNIVMCGYSYMLEHLKTQGHRNNKTSAEWTLQDNCSDEIQDFNFGILPDFAGAMNVKGLAL